MLVLDYKIKAKPLHSQAITLVGASSREQVLTLSVEFHALDCRGSVNLAAAA